MATSNAPTELVSDDRDIPLCVDLDGTLLKSDALIEGYLRCIKINPLHSIAAIAWLIRGKARLKAEIARRAVLNVDLLPINEELLEWLRLEHGRGRRLVLCTAANQLVAERVAARFGIFEQTIGSDTETNRSGSNKASILEERYGRFGFDYAGNAWPDLRVWRSARKAIVVSPTLALRGRVKTLPRVDRVFPIKKRTFAVWAHALRLHQWSKNLLIFLPAIASHDIFTASVARSALLAFLWFGLCASGTYLINDLLDLDADRSHPRKRFRALAAGDVPLAGAMLAATAFIVVAFGGALITLGVEFAAILLCYLAGTLWYSATLKRIGMVDVLTLAGLYTVRVIAGGVAVSVVPSFWLLAFSMFLFLSLAMVKRYTELSAARAAGGGAAAGRGYTTDDLPLLLSAGTSSGFISVLVLALYMNDGSGHLYSHPAILWLLCPLVLYWICRVWRKTHRGELHDDPVVFAMKDRQSLVVGGLCALLMWAAI